MGMLNTLQLHVWRGDIEAGERLFEKVEPYLANKEAEVRADLKAARALLLNATGQYEPALADAERGLAESLDPSFPLSARRNLPQAADAAFALDRLDKVEELIGAVRGRHRAGRQPTLDAHIARCQARLAAARGDSETAAVGFAQAIDAFGAVLRPFWQAVTRLDAGEAALLAGRDEEGRWYLEQARATFSELRARPWVERVDVATSRGSQQAERARPAV